MVSTATSFYSVTTQWLLTRLKRADLGWERAMANPAYRDEPLAEDRPFTALEELRMWWAEAWRHEYHWLEGELYRQPEIRKGMVEGLNTREPLTVYER